MDRFYWFDGQDSANERHITKGKSVRLYDGDEKTTFDCGTLTLTNFKLVWNDDAQKDRVIALNLSLVKKIEFEGSGLFSSAKIIVHLQKAAKDKPSGPKQISHNSYIKLSFRHGGQEEFGRSFKNSLTLKDWEKVAAPAKKEEPEVPEITLRHVGIGGIERKIQEKYEQTDSSITMAFKDLDALIEKAKDMVALAEKFSKKLNDKEISVTDDETVAFKSYLLSMGIDNPVTRETHGSGNRYHQELAKELATFLKDLLEKEGGVMTVTDVYCRFNRARGMELVSPDDVANAAKLFQHLHLPMRLRKFDSGVLVVQSLSQTEEQIIDATSKTIEENGPLSSEELGHLLGLAITLAKERLLLSEKAGKLCRDDSVEGLRFYVNEFNRDS